MKININDLTLNAKLAISREEKERGMMNKKFDETFNGMLFIYSFVVFWDPSGIGIIIIIPFFK
jgi:uncharacterized membrane protein (UPF0127 family)